MAETKIEDPRTEELLKAFDREQSTAHDLNRRHDESTKDAHERDRQVFIERRLKPR